MPSYNNYIPGSVNRNVAIIGKLDGGGNEVTASTFARPASYRSYTGPDIASLAAGWSNVNRQQYVDRATTDAKKQQENMLAAGERRAAEMGRKQSQSPMARIQAAAETAAAGTRAGQQADDETYRRRMALAGLTAQDRQFKQNQMQYESDLAERQRQYDANLAYNIWNQNNNNNNVSYSSPSIARNAAKRALSDYGRTQYKANYGTGSLSSGSSLFNLSNSGTKSGNVGNTYYESYAF